MSVCAGFQSNELVVANIEGAQDKNVAVEIYIIEFIDQDFTKFNRLYIKDVVAVLEEKHGNQMESNFNITTSNIVIIR